MVDVILDALYDSLKAFILIFIIYIIVSFIEFKVTNKLSKNNSLSPLYGSLMGLIPECGVSVVASDLYLKNHISVGTLIAVFLSCSDEALPILISEGNEKSLMVIPLIITKFLVGFIFGFLIDLIISKRKVNDHLLNCNHHDIEIHTGCCNHHIDDEEEGIFEKNIWHPFLHSLKLFAYILIINIIFGTFIYYLGEDIIMNFLTNNRYFAPVYSTLIGLIPNCVSSVIIIRLYLSGGLSFGATLAGLCVNAGLGLVYLFKDKKHIKNTLLICLTLIVISLLTGYVCCIILGF